MISSARTVPEYLASLPEDRRAALGVVRQVILDHLPKGYEERIIYGFIGYVVPHSLYPKGYHCDPTKPLTYAGLASRKGQMSIHLMTVYGDPATEKWFRKAWTGAGKKLNMGKSCVHFKKVEDVPLDVVAQAIARMTPDAYIQHVEETLQKYQAAKKERTAAKPKRCKK